MLSSFYNDVIELNGDKNNDNNLLVRQRNYHKAIVALKTIHHPLRVKILQLLETTGEMNVTTIYVKLRIEQSVASQQLAILRANNVVNARRAGKEIFYSVNYARIKELNDIVEMILKD